MARLVLGPLLRYTSDREATVWVETDSACEVEVLNSRDNTLEIAGHHYALTCVKGLEPGRTYDYEVRLDGEKVWPEPDSDFPPSVIRTYEEGGPFRLMFGSCRLGYPHEEPYVQPSDENKEGREVDALYALALRMRDRPTEEWPHALVLLGDQMYADEVSPATQEFIRSRRDPSKPPGYEVADFEEYTRLYWESWGDPVIRWLLSTVPSCMVFDDHDVHDDWNTSQAWRDEYRAKPWWRSRITGAYMSYWIYQHLGNLASEHLDTDEIYDQVMKSDEPTRVLYEFAVRADESPDGTQWSYRRDFCGNTRLVMIDSRGGRLLEENERAMVDEDEWKWIEGEATGGFDHLLIGTSLPFLLAPGMHDLEAWNEAVCAGAWGRRAAREGERIRQGLDLEHWAAFQRSFRDLAKLIEDVGAGRKGEPPATILMLSGDVHHAYIADVAFREGSGVRSRVHQLTCSPFRNPLNRRERAAVNIAMTKPFGRLARALARSAGVDDPPIRWRIDNHWFDNQVASLEFEGRSVSFKLEKTTPEDWPHPKLETVIERRLA
jgi:PhoD-like phosphatase